MSLKFGYVTFRGIYTVKLWAFLLLSLPLLAQSPDNHKFMEYGILDFSRGDGGAKPVGEVYFTARAYGAVKSKLFYKLPLGYNKLIWVHVSNRSKVDQKIRLQFSPPRDILMGVKGAGGDHPLEIKAGKSASIPVFAFSQDASSGLHKFSAKLIDAADKTLDAIAGRLYFSPVKLQLSLREKSKDGLIKTFELKNNGGELANLNLSLKGATGLAMTPRVEHYLLPKNSSVTFSVYPTGSLKQNIRAQLVASASGTAKSFDFNIDIPTGQRVQVLSVDPIVRLRRKDWYCTNRPIIHMKYAIPYIKMQKLSDQGFARALAADIQKQAVKFDTVNNRKADHFMVVRKGITTILIAMAASTLFVIPTAAVARSTAG